MLTDDCHAVQRRDRREGNQRAQSTDRRAQAASLAEKRGLMTALWLYLMDNVLDSGNKYCIHIVIYKDLLAHTYTIEYRIPFLCCLASFS